MGNFQAVSWLCSPSSTCSGKEPLGIFQWPGCPFCHQTNSVKALTETQSTDPNHQWTPFPFLSNTSTTAAAAVLTGAVLYIQRQCNASVETVLMLSSNVVGSARKHRRCRQLADRTYTCNKHSHTAVQLQSASTLPAPQLLLSVFVPLA